MRSLCPLVPCIECYKLHDQRKHYRCYWKTTSPHSKIHWKTLRFKKKNDNLTRNIYLHNKTVCNNDKFMFINMHRYIRSFAHLNELSMEGMCINIG